VSSREKLILFNTIPPTKLFLWCPTVIAALITSEHSAIEIYYYYYYSFFIFRPSVDIFLRDFLNLQKTEKIRSLVGGAAHCCVTGQHWMLQQNWEPLKRKKCASLPCAWMCGNSLPKFLNKFVGWYTEDTKRLNSNWLKDIMRVYSSIICLIMSGCKLWGGTWLTWGLLTYESERRQVTATSQRNGLPCSQGMI